MCKFGKGLHVGAGGDPRGALRLRHAAPLLVQLPAVVCGRSGPVAHRRALPQQERPHLSLVLILSDSKGKSTELRLGSERELLYFYKLNKFLRARVQCKMVITKTKKVRDKLTHKWYLLHLNLNLLKMQKDHIMCY